MAFKWYNDIVQDIDKPSEIIEGQRNGFLFSLMVLSSYVMQADGKIMHSEMEYVRHFIEEHFGQEKKDDCERLLLTLFATSKNVNAEVWRNKIEKCTRELTDCTAEEDRLLLLAFLIKIVRADNVVETNEIDSISNIASWLDISLAAAVKIEDLKREVYWSWEI